MYTKVLNLIVSRLVIILMLISLALLVRTSWNPNLELGPLILFSGITSAISLGYYAILRLSHRYLLQIYLQIFGDVLLATWLIYLMRTSDFSLVLLYLVIVLSASMVLPRSGVLIVGLSCAISYGGLFLLFYLKILEDPASLKLINQYNILPLYTLALLVSTILGGQLAERLRRSDSELAVTTRYLKDLQAFNERIVQSINSGLITTNLEGDIVSFNRAAEEITGYKTALVRGRHFYDIFGNLSSMSLFDHSKLPSAGRRFPRFDIDCKTQDDKIIHLGFSASFLTTEFSTVTGYVFSFQNLTEIIKLEQEIRRRDRLAALGKMAAGIAHEIRNPLAAMRGAIQLLHSEMELTEDQSHLMKIVLRESDRLNQIITDFLAYAKPSPLRLSAIDIITLIEDTITLLKHSPEVKSNHQIELVAATKPIIFAVDSAQIHQVIWNLSRNALQAMPDGGILRISVRILPSGELEIYVRDTGTGMTEQQLERMFEPFNSSRNDGTGLGMAIVYQIVDDHQGVINVVSIEKDSNNERSGTEVMLRLPSHEISLTSF